MEKIESKKIYIAIAIAVIVLAIGFYLYYFYPQIIPGLASTSLKQDLNVLVVGFDDMDSVSEGEISADIIVLAQLFPDSQEIKFTNIVLEDKSFGEEVEEEELKELMDEVGEIVSTNLNYYFSISYQGFVNLIDNLDGLVVTREEKLNVPDLELALVQGNNYLSGEEALNYARWYDYTKGEQDRIQRQQEIISAVIDKALVDKTLLDLPELFNTTVDTFKSVDTNFEYTIVTDIVEHLMNNKNQTISYDVFVENGE